MELAYSARPASSPGGGQPVTADDPAYTDDGALLVAFLARQGLPTTARSIHREQAKAFIAASLSAPRLVCRRRVTGPFSSSLPGWTRRDVVDGLPMAKLCPPNIARSPSRARG